MTKYYLLALISLILINTTCNSQNKNPSSFLPEGYVIYETHITDLNNDAQDDYILIIKATNLEHIVVNRFDKKVDRNRRGVILLFKTEKGYQLADENHNCFTSENEDGGVYYVPQLSVEADKGDIIFNYEHGRYGYWNYRFRFIESNYKLIEYNSVSSNGPVTNSETTINFLTKMKVFRKNINEDVEGNDEVFKETKTQINIDKLICLSEIKDFEELDVINQAISLTDYINGIKIKTLPLNDATSFDSFIDSDDYDDVDVTILRLEDIYPNFYKQGYNFIAISHYKLQLSNQFHSVVVTVLKGDNEMETQLINYDLNGDIIDSVIISYDEIAEGAFSSSSRIENLVIKKTSITWMDEKQEHVEYFQINENGLIFLTK